MKKHFQHFTTLVMFLALLTPNISFANRLWSSGFELQSVTTGVEFDGQSGTGITINTTTKHAGAAALRVQRTGTAGTSYVYKQFSSGGNADYYARVYIYVATAPDVDTAIMEFHGAVPTTHSRIGVRLNTDLTLQGYISNAGPTSVGGPSAELSLNTWYMIEMRLNQSGTTATNVDFRIEGSSFASGSGLTLETSNATMYFTCGIDVGEWGEQATADIYFDDIAINNSSGSYQNTFAGPGYIVHMQPDSAGNTDNSLSSPNGWQNIDEVTPDDATTLAVLDAANDILSVNLESATSAGIPSGKTITLVHVGIREAAASAASENWQLGIKSQSGGTIFSGTRTTHNDTTYTTNGDPDTSPRNYTLTSYTNPQAGGAWTSALLDTAQIVASTTDATPDVNISTLWALVEYADPIVTPALEVSPYSYLNSATLLLNNGIMWVR